MWTRRLSSGPLSQFLGRRELAGIASARTGLPVNITVSRAASALLDGNTSGQRPSLVPGVPIYAADQNINNWFNPAAFRPPPTGPGAIWAATLPMVPARSRSTRHCRRASASANAWLHFRAAAFNLFNHPEYKTPGASVGSVSGSGTNLSIKPSASFGRITGILNTGATGTGAPRRPMSFQFRAEF